MTFPRTPSDPAIIRVLNDFRATIDAREDAAMLEMARRYIQVQDSVQAEITALAFEMEKRRLEGKVITEQLIWRQERYQRIAAQLEAQIKSFNGDALAMIERGQYENATLGITAANEAISASYFDAGALGPAWNRINVNAVESMIGFAADGSPLKALLARDFGLAVDGLTQALVSGMAQGLGAAQIAKLMSDGTAMGLERALLISRTETMRAYRTGSTKQYRASGVVEKFYRLVKKATACAACLMLDGQEFDVAEELSDHPRGKCQVVASIYGLGKPQWLEGPDWFLQQDPQQQREILGPERYQLWQDGRIELSDVARMRHSDEWGDSPRIATVRELTR